MATYTPNLNLKKPDYTDLADVADFNANMDIIDGLTQDDIPDGITNKAFTAAEKDKLAGIEPGANKIIIANNLTETIPGKALDATQGKVLAEQIRDISVEADTIPLSPETAALYGLTGDDATVDKALGRAVKTSDKLIINLLLTNLRFTTNSSDIDAWCDLLEDASMINTGASSNYLLEEGQLSCAEYLSHLNYNSDYKLSTDYTEIAQTFTPTSNVLIGGIKVKLSKLGNPSDAVGLKICNTSGGNPNTVLATSKNTYSSTDLSLGREDKYFQFEGGLALTAGTQYAFVLYRTGSPNNTNSYQLAGIPQDLYSGGSLFTRQSGVWKDRGGDAYFKIYHTNAVVVWKAVTSSEKLSAMAIAAIQTTDVGTVSWFVSDDGVDWIPITVKNMELVNFATTNVYIKALIMEGATIESVAWGGR